jgi:predicted nucleotidyltransferase
LPWEAEDVLQLNTVLQKLDGDRTELDRLGVKSLSVFGSVARGEATEGSDIDFLVEFDGPAGFFRIARLQRHLQDLLEVRVDLVTLGGLRASMRERILREAVRAA